MATAAISIGLSVATGLLSSALAPKPQQKNNVDDNLAILKSEYGVAIPRVYGRARVTGNVFWGREIDRREWGENTVYDGTFAVLLGEGEIEQIGRIWLNNELWYHPNSTDPAVVQKSIDRFTQRATGYLGTSTQLPDPTIESIEGVGNVPGFRNLSYLVFRDLGLEKYGLTIPKVEVELIERSTPLTIVDVVEDLLQRSGLQPNQYQINLSNTPNLEGFTFQQAGQPVREALEDLQNIYLFQIIDDGSSIIIRDQEQPLRISLTRNLQGTRSFGQPAVPLLVERNEKREDLPSKIEIEYPNINSDFNRGIQAIDNSVALHVNDLNFKSKVVMDDSTAQTAAARLMRLYYDQSKRFEKVMLPIDAFDLVAGDTVEIEIVNWKE